MKLENCYFQFNGVDKFVIIPKEFFDKEESMDLSGETPTDLPEIFSVSESSVYKFKGTSKKAKYALGKAGAIEKDMFYYGNGWDSINSQ